VTILGIIGLASVISGFLSGLLGIGGGIIMAPILIFLPGWAGIESLPMKVITGLTITQGLVACLFGTLYHKKFNFVSGRLFGHMGLPVFLMSFLGGYVSHLVSNGLLLVLFAALALVASILILVPVRTDCENPDVNTLEYKKSRAVAASAGVGLLGGMVGQGGSFIMIPLMTSYVQIPTRIAIGSNLAIVTLATAAGFLGKALSGQIEWLYTIPVLAAAIPATTVGSIVSRKVSVLHLRRILAVIIAIAAVRIWLLILWK
jgi:uncharacterized membrane protein YfcA